MQPDTRILAISASSEKNDLDVCYQVGMVGHLMKPFTEKELFEAMVEALGLELSNEKMHNLEALPDADLSELKRQSNGDQVFYEEMITIFISSTSKSMHIINQALEKEDWSVISETAHKMAAPCKHLQAMQLYQLIKQLEKLSGSGGNPAEIASLVRKTEAKLSHLHEYLQANLQG
jgi:HPt (histidine-containing phosphotransfer) domain-containing protein